MEAQRKEAGLLTARITSEPIWFVLPALLTLMYTCTRVAYPLDFWHQVATGELVWLRGSVPTHDTFSYTIGGQPVVNQNWLAQLGFYWLHRLGGFPLAQFAAGFCYAVAILVLTRLAWRRSGKVFVASTMGFIALAMAASNLTVRPQMISVPLFCIELYALYLWPGRWRTVAVVAAVELIWTNTHGAFPLGIVLPGMFLVGAAWQAFFGSGGTSLRHEGRENDAKTTPFVPQARATLLSCRAAVGRLATDRVTLVYFVCVLVGLVVMFCNPRPDKTLDYVFGVVSRAPERQIGEWLPTAAGGHSGIAYAASIAMVLIVLGLSRKRLEPVDLILLVSFAILGNRAQRMILWWGLILAAVLAPQIVALLKSWAKRLGKESQEPERSVSNLATLVVLIAASVFFTPWTRQHNFLLPPAKRQPIPDDEPRGIRQFLEEKDFRGRIFCPMEWSAYFVWHLRPDAKTFVDTRVDFFPDEIWDEFVEVGNGQARAEAILDKHQVDLVIWNRQWNDALPTALEASPRWTKVFDDRLSIAFARNRR